MRIARLVVLCWLALCGSAWAQCSISNLTACPSPPLNVVTANTFSGAAVNVLGGSLTWSDATKPRNINQFSAWTGNSSDTQGYILNRFQVNDQVNYTGPQFGVGYNFEDDYGGTGSTGSKFAANVLLLQSLGANADSGADHFYTALTASAFARFSQPGSSSTTPLGRIFGFNAVGQVQPGFTATNLFQVASAEFDVNIPSGSSSFIRSGVTIASLTVGGVQGYGADNALWFYGNGAKWRYGINFSDTQAWPIDDTVGTIIGANYGSGRNSAPDMAAQWGVDFLQVAFPHTGNPYDGAMVRGSGWSIDGVGNAQFGTTYLTSGSTGLAIDAKGSVGQSAVIAAAGSGYEGGVLVFGGDAASFGGLWTVATSGGVPTGAVTELVHPVFATTSSPPTTITPTNRNKASQGSGFQITETWNTTATQLSLQPSGGLIIAAGLPTSAPSTHCALWSNSNVITRTTCP